jgi:hypothetical protein
MCLNGISVVFFSRVNNRKIVVERQENRDSSSERREKEMVADAPGGCVFQEERLYLPI